nr:putative F-box protein At5g62660 [Ipomoea batatas]
MGLFGGLFDLSTGRSIYLQPNYPAMYFGISNSNIIGNGDFVLTRNSSSIGKCPIAVLGFDSISERYKVFASEVFYNGEQVFWKQHWVLTLGVDESWREIRSTIFVGLTDAAVHIHGIIYFIPQVTERESSSKMIVAMDVARERIIRFIPLPFPSGYHQSKQRVREEQDRDMDVEDQVSSGGGVGEADGLSSIGGEDVWKRIEISGVSKYSSSSYISDMEVVVHVDDEIVASF